MLAPRAACSPSPFTERGLADKGTTLEFNLQTCIPDFLNLTPLAPLSARGEGGTLVPRTARSPSP